MTSCRSDDCRMLRVHPRESRMSRKAQATKDLERANGLSECQSNACDLSLWFAVEDRVILTVCES
jgi:hypothetical protein